MSQYASSITGDVIVDLRVVNDKWINFGDDSRIISEIINTKNVISLSNTTTKFSTKSLKLSRFDTNGTRSEQVNNHRIDLNFRKEFSPKNKFTFSFWVYNDLDLINYSKISGEIWHRCRLSLYPFIYFTHNSDNAQSSNTNKFHIQYDNDYEDFFNKPSSVVAWHHYACTYDGSKIYVFLNGQLMLQISYSSSSVKNNIKGIDIQLVSGFVMNNYYDDIVFIYNQCLWTSNFTVPNTFLTGSKSLPKRLYNKNIIYPTPNDRNEYFDKAFLY